MVENELQLRMISITLTFSQPGFLRTISVHGRRSIELVLVTLYIVTLYIVTLYMLAFREELVLRKDVLVAHVP